MTRRPAFHRRTPVLTTRRPRASLLARSPARVAALALASMAAALLWPDRAADSVAELASVQLPPTVAEATGPVEVVDVEAPVVWSDVRPPTVSALLRSSADEAVVARVWWLVAGTDDTRPWERPTGRGTPVDVTVQPGEATSVDLPVEEAPPSGTWTLSVWAHTVEQPGAESSAHSHGTGTRPYVTVLATDDDVVRLGPPGRHTALTGVEAVGRLADGDGGAEAEHADDGPAAGDTGGPDALVTVRSTSAQPVFVEVRCYLAPPGTHEPWADDDAVASAVAEVTAEGASRAVGCTFDELPERGSWELSAFARLAGRNDALGHQDGLYARDPVVLAGRVTERAGSAGEAAARP